MKNPHSHTHTRSAVLIHLHTVQLCRSQCDSSTGPHSPQPCYRLLTSLQSSLSTRFRPSLMSIYLSRCRALSGVKGMHRAGFMHSGHALGYVRMHRRRADHSQSTRRTHACQRGLQHTQGLPSTSGQLPPLQLSEASVIGRLGFASRAPPTMSATTAAGSRLAFPRQRLHSYPALVLDALQVSIGCVRRGTGLRTQMIRGLWI